MKIKTFKIFENESSKSNSFSANQHKEFCEEIAKWQEQTKQPVLWCLYANPKPQEGFNAVYRVESAKRYWDMYVKGDKKFVVLETGDSLIGLIQSGDTIELAIDNMDRKVDVSKFKEMI